MELPLNKLLIIPILGLALACGGGGGSTPAGPSTPSVFEGPWVGTMRSNGGSSVSAEALVLANGTVRYVGSNGIQGSGKVSGTAAALQSSGTLYAPTGYQFTTGLTTSTFSLAGSGVAGVSLSGTYAAAGDAGTFTFVYDAAADYTTPVVLANVAGAYQSTTTTSGYSTQGRLSSTGVFTGTDAYGGTFTGTLAAVDPAKNAFTVAVTYSAPGIPATAYNGLAFFEFGGNLTLNIQASAASSEFAGSFVRTGP